MKPVSIYSAAVTTAGLLMCTSSPGLAQTNDHTDGFFLRISGGGGAAATERRGIKLTGASAEFDFAIGAMISPNLALHGTVYGWIVSQPDMETGVGSWELAGDVSLAAFGVGLTYYFMPANVYLSGSFGVGSIAMTEIYSNTSRDDVAVLAGEVAFGKEWWIGEDWGLGAALAVGYHFVPVDDDEDTRSGLSYGLRLSATMN